MVYTNIVVVLIYTVTVSVLAVWNARTLCYLILRRSLPVLLAKNVVHLVSVKYATSSFDDLYYLAHTLLAHNSKSVCAHMILTTSSYSSTRLIIAHILVGLLCTL